MEKHAPVADVVVHLHPRTSCDDRERIERELRAVIGVTAVRFNADEHPHAMVVQYDPELVNSQVILSEVRKCDIDATMAGL